MRHAGVPAHRTRFLQAVQPRRWLLTPRGPVTRSRAAPASQPAAPGGAVPCQERGRTGGQMPGLTWLVQGPGPQGLPAGCMTFVRGADERAVLTGLGVDPDDAMPPGDPEF